MDSFYILATSPSAADQRRVLKRAGTFAVFDPVGDFVPGRGGEFGLFHRGTRFLGTLEFGIDGHRPLLLSSAVRNDNSALITDLTNPDLGVEPGPRVAVRRSSLHVHRASTVREGELCVEFTVHNYCGETLAIELALRYAADFADVFEVRGSTRKLRGETADPDVSDSGVVLGYRGRDGIERRTRLRLEPLPDSVGPTQARRRVIIAAGATVHWHLTVHCEVDAPSLFASIGRHPAGETTAPPDDGLVRCMGVRSSSEHFDAWIERSRADLRMLTTRVGSEIYPYAGIPWYSTPFGRDGLITALQCIDLDPNMARGVLSFLAATQAEHTDPAHDAEPGKILHEAREGEMARLGEVPFGRYYGSVDATPLFVLLAGAHLERTDDVDFARRLLPHVQAALGWIDESGDGDGDGLFEYVRHSQDGLSSQGWKDSDDSIFHADGRLAEGPIALCEVQGYIFAAWNAAATILERLGDVSHAEALRQRAQELRARFEATFWSDELGTYALALDGDKRPCAVRASNAGHALFAGIASSARAASIGKLLLAERCYSGWGIRTVAAREARYNPMSYHNGSVWPHDNAMIAAGLASYGHKRQTLQILTDLCAVARFADLYRLPELFCGFARRARERPTAYPVACAPQAWAAGAVYMLLKAALGMHVSAARREIRFCKPALPPWLETVALDNVAVGEARADLVIERRGDGASVEMRRQSGEVSAVLVD